MDGVRELSPLSEIRLCEEPGWPLRAPEELVEAVRAAGVAKHVERGARLFSFGEEAEGIYLVVKGRARARLPGAAGRELMSRMAGEGAVLGLPAALCAKSYQFDVEALETVEARFLETAAVNEILRQRPELCMRVMAMMCDELSALRQTRDHMRSCKKEACGLHEACAHSGTLG